jgi:hypothetical protein
VRQTRKFDLEKHCRTPATPPVPVRQKAKATDTQLSTVNGSRSPQAIQNVDTPYKLPPFTIVHWCRRKLQTHSDGADSLNWCRHKEKERVDERRGHQIIEQTRRRNASEHEMPRIRKHPAALSSFT